ncbi:MAG: hypothetical protein HY319_16525 [Armatimonadetes bacterium]|nr:hypothetical protein [Armatimonadota bacterium]
MITLQLESLDDFFAQVEARIKGVRHFRSGKIDDYGNVVGVHEYEAGSVPFEHQDHFYDEDDRVVRLDRYEREFSKPTRRFYFYEGNNPKVLESVWFDRYGKIDNIHRYLYDGRTGLMIERAEYSRDGGLHYRILSTYDDPNLPQPQLIEEKWLDRLGNLIKRYEYERNSSGDLVVERSFGKADVLIGTYRFRYHADGALSDKEWLAADDDELRSAFRYKYDGEGRLAETILEDAGGKIECRQLLTHDEIGNVVEERWLDAAGQVVKQLRF